MSPVKHSPDNEYVGDSDLPISDYVGYAPMDCPHCGRSRLEYYLKGTTLIMLRCEKCHIANWRTAEEE